MGSESTGRALARIMLIALCLVERSGATGVGTGMPKPDAIELELKPKVCTLASDDKRCETHVHAQWRSPREESLCLIILDRPDVKQCWEHYSEGFFNIDLVFAEDLIFQLRDPALQEVLAAEVLRVIRETLPYRHKRRQPWNILD